jgi:hypothetical protein
MDSHNRRIKIACLLLVSAMSSALLAASMALPPAVSVEECASLEEGTPVRVVGVVSYLRSYDSGTEVVTLVDRGGGSEARVICSPSRAPSLCSILSIGDLVRVEGEVSHDSSITVIFALRDGVSVLARSELTLSVEFLCDNWRLFEYDRFNISGEVVDDAGASFLQSFGGERRIALRFTESAEPVSDCGKVIVDCTLFVDLRSMVIFLRAWALRAPV